MAQTASMETYRGWVRTPADAIKLFEACRLGLLPRVQRRLSEKERQSIKSGSVFVWDEREAGMRRWTDGKSWSASRVSGSFLTYREMEGKRGVGFTPARSRVNARSPDGSQASDNDQEGEPEGYRYKTDGLMKQSFSITTSSGQHLHLISYYSRPAPGTPDLTQPTTDPLLRQIVPPKGMYPETTAQESAVSPALTRTPMLSYSQPGPHDQAYHPSYWGSPAWMGVEVAAWSTTSPNKAHANPYGRSGSEMGYQAYPHPPQPQRVHQYPPPIPPNNPAHYDRLPPPPPNSYPMVDRQMSRSPRSQQLQQAAQAVMVDPRMNAGVRHPQDSGYMMVVGPGHPHGLQTHTPPHAASSPISVGDGSVRKASLSSILLHPATNGSEPNSAKSSTNRSASSSPPARTAAAAHVSADQKALQSLNRNFRI
ncbi:Gti1/Pac2 family-domain-containing protein [Xylaria palmicola]|nr:Gti1/Pac2 family-domain-containing protein [Xylaria palmicola]